MEPHGRDVMGYLGWAGLQVATITSPTRRPTMEECLELIRSQGCAATLANSGHEPFGLVGLEVMAAGGIAVVGSTGEDYATSLQNALVTETPDPGELVEYLLELSHNEELATRLRLNGRATAEQFIWPNVLADLRVKVEYLARQQGALS
jgi:glycosyltransferase involved in cell wall biosynthesis